MADLDTLRPEVRTALEVITGEAVCTCHEAYTSRGMKDPACNHDLKEYVDTIRAELLRLAHEETALSDLVDRQAKILTGVANALEGQPRPNHLHSHHDLAEVAEHNAAELQRLTVANGDLRNWINEAEQDAGCWQRRAEKAEIENARLSAESQQRTAALSTVLSAGADAVGREEEYRRRAEKAEAELAALKARIANAPTAYLTSRTGIGPCNLASMAHGAVFDSDCYGKTVRLVVEE